MRLIYVSDQSGLALEGGYTLWSVFRWKCCIRKEFYYIDMECEMAISEQLWFSRNLMTISFRSRGSHSIWSTERWYQSSVTVSTYTESHSFQEWSTGLDEEYKSRWTRFTLLPGTIPSCLNLPWKVTIETINGTLVTIDIKVDISKVLVL
jgi:hypothetical protein